MKLELKLVGNQITRPLECNDFGEAGEIGAAFFSKGIALSGMDLYYSPWSQDQTAGEDLYAVCGKGNHKRDGGGVECALPVCDGCRIWRV